MNKILVATDFSKTATQAVRYAINISEKFSANVIILNIASLDGSETLYGMASMVEDVIQKKSEMEMQRLIKKLQEEFGNNLRVTTRIEKGESEHKVIEKIAAEENVELIVIGLKGVNEVERVFIGGVAASVAMHATHPVLLIPQAVTYREVKHIVDATDLNQSEFEFKKVYRFASHFNAKITVLHIYNNEAEAKKSDLAILTEGIKVKYNVDNVTYDSAVNTSVADGIEEYVAKHNVDILVMFTHKKLFYQRMFNPSTTKELAFESTVPLLVLKS